MFACSSTVWLVSLALTWWLARPGQSVRILDQPNQRSLHVTPVPRTGGVAIMTAIGGGFIATYLLYSVNLILGWITAGIICLTLISLWEDYLGVSRRVRLVVQILAAMLLPMVGLAAAKLQFGQWSWILPTWLSWSCTIVVTVWMTNLYNFMDGMDGFAGGMTVIGFGTMAILGWQVNAYEFAWINALIAAAAGGFLVWNFPPARIFMGDGGSIPLGYAAAAMALWGQHDSIVPIWLIGLLFSPFIIDATVTILQRIKRREHIFEPHCTHYYQRLVRCGWGHRKTVLHEYMLMLTCACCVLVAVNLTTVIQIWLLATWGVIYWLLAWQVDALTAK